MHPPPFRFQDPISNWPDCILRLHCCRIVDCSIRQLIHRHGDRTFRKLVSGLRCKECGRPPSPVYLMAGIPSEAIGSGCLYWTVELVPKEKPLTPYETEAEENLKQRTRTPFELKVIEQRIRG